MTSLQCKDDCQTNDPNDLFPMAIESLRFPLDNSMQIMFTGHYNGFNVEVKSTEESALLYHMGCFGKGSSSRSRPNLAHNNSAPQLMRKRQFLKRNYWHKKFSSDVTSDEDIFLKENDELIADMLRDSAKKSKKDIIDLVSSDDDNEDNVSGNIGRSRSFHTHNKEDIVVIVPNSDSEEDNYFANLKPKCCLNKIKTEEKLMLTLQEAFFLTYGLGCLQIVNCDNILSIEQTWDLFSKVDRNFTSKYVVYHYFRSKGYVVKPGIKFGGDYLLYKEGPGVTHADYIVIIKYDNQSFDWISILGHMRMATTTVKEILMVEVIKPIEDCVKLPEELSSFSVQEILLTRNIPVAINTE